MTSPSDQRDCAIASLHIESVVKYSITEKRLSNCEKSIVIFNFALQIILYLNCNAKVRKNPVKQESFWPMIAKGDLKISRKVFSASL